MRTPLTDDEAIAAIRQLADRPWDQGSVKQCVVKGDTACPALGCFWHRGMHSPRGWRRYSCHRTGQMAETTKDLDPK